jgi:protease I
MFLTAWGLKFEPSRVRSWPLTKFAIRAFLNQPSRSAESRDLAAREWPVARSVWPAPSPDPFNLVSHPRFNDFTQLRRDETEARYDRRELMENTEMETRMNDKPLSGRTIALMVANGFDEIEFTEPQKRLIEAGAQVRVVSRANGLVNGWYDGGWGHFFPVDVDLAETLAIDYDGLIVPGGIRSIDKMADDPHAKRVLRAFLRADMPVALVGDGVKLMVATEDATGRSITGSDEVRDVLVEAGADWRDESVVVAGNLVTGSGADVVGQVMALFADLVAQYENEVTQAA